MKIFRCHPSEQQLKMKSTKQNRARTLTNQRTNQTIPWTTKFMSSEHCFSIHILHCYIIIFVVGWFFFSFCFWVSGKIHFTKNMTQTIKHSFYSPAQHPNAKKRKNSNSINKMVSRTSHGTIWLCYKLNIPNIK